jgi:Sulfotransferase domain
MSVETERLRFRPKQLTASLQLPPASGSSSSVLAFSIWKAGSSLLYSLLREICPHVGLTYFGISEEFFRQNKADLPFDVGSVYVDRGYCYGGARCFPRYPIPLLESAKTVLLVRDPRDMLVSAYFSTRQSHILPEGEGGKAQILKAQREIAKATPINEWVQCNYGKLLIGFEGYFAQGFPRRSNVAIFRYEDVIFRKEEWLTDLAAWYGWDVPTEVIKEVVARHDIFPDFERPDEHVRQVRPGNYKSYLTADVLSRIEFIFQPYMSVLGY